MGRVDAPQEELLDAVSDAVGQCRVPRDDLRLSSVGDDAQEMQDIARGT